MEMKSWFECKVKIDKMVEGGVTKPETCTYLVDALNFTEAENRIIKEITPFTSGQLDVTNIKRARFSELFMSDSELADKWYKVKCNYITLDEKTQTEKKTATNMLVQAANFHDALKNFDNGMKGSMMDYQIALIQETTILDVFPYEAQSKGDAAKPEYEV